MSILIAVIEFDKQRKITDFILFDSSQELINNFKLIEKISLLNTVKL